MSEKILNFLRHFYFLNRYVYGSKKTAQCTSTAEYFRNNFRFFKGDFINETNHTDFYVPYNDIQLCGL